MEEPKILKKGESTFRNGGSGICGGVISKTIYSRIKSQEKKNGWKDIIIAEMDRIIS